MIDKTAGGTMRSGHVSKVWNGLVLDGCPIAKEVWYDLEISQPGGIRPERLDSNSPWCKSDGSVRNTRRAYAGRVELPSTVSPSIFHFVHCVIPFLNLLKSPCV